MSGRPQGDDPRDPAFWGGLSDPQLDACARLEPGYALLHAGLRLTDTRFVWCSERAPVQALRAAPGRLPAAFLEELVACEPAAVAQFAAARLSPVQVARVADAAPCAALEHLALRLDFARLRACAERFPVQALRSDAACTALGGEAVDRIARRLIEREAGLHWTRAEAFVTVLQRAPHVVDPEWFEAQILDAASLGSRPAIHQLCFTSAMSRMTPALLERLIDLRPLGAVVHGGEFLSADQVERAMADATGDEIELVLASAPAERLREIQRRCESGRECDVWASVLCARRASEVEEAPEARSQSCSM